MGKVSKESLGKQGGTMTMTCGVPMSEGQPCRRNVEFGEAVGLHFNASLFAECIPSSQDRPFDSNQDVGHVKNLT